MEHCVDLAARKLDSTPFEIRRRNLLRPEQFPYEAPNGARYDSGDYERTLDMALEMAGYRALREEQTRARAAGRLVGIGVYTGVELSAVAMSMFTLLGPDSPFGTSMPESARVRSTPPGDYRRSDFSLGRSGTAHVCRQFFGRLLRRQTRRRGSDRGGQPLRGSGHGAHRQPPSRHAVGRAFGAADRIADKLRKVAGVILEANAGRRRTFQMVN